MKESFNYNFENINFVRINSKRVFTTLMLESYKQNKVDEFEIRFWNGWKRIFPMDEYPCLDFLLKNNILKLDPRGN